MEMLRYETFASPGYQKKGERKKYMNGNAQAHRSPQKTVPELLQKLRIDTGASCVLLISSGGNAVEIAGHTTGLDVVSVSALVAANFMAASELARLVGNGSVFRSSYHEGPDYDIYAHDINGSFLIAVIFGTKSKTGLVRFYTSETVEKLMPLLDEETAYIELDEDLSPAIDKELEQLFGNDDQPGKLISFQEALTSGLISSELETREVG